MVKTVLGSTQYQYYKDDALKQIDYTGSNRAPVSVGYTYEPEYARLQTMLDGQGTTAYTYKPVGALGAGKVATIDGPLANDTIDLSYDELGRSTGQSINGVANTPHYDNLGRVDSVTNALGTFGYHYDGVSSRLATIDLPNGQHTTFGYHDNLGDRALANITHLTSAGEIISKFDYAYGTPGRISEWTQQRGTQPAAAYQLQYDDADQLRDATLRDVSTQAVVKHFAYAYDAAGNRTTEQIDNLVATEIPNQLNQLITRKAGGEIKVRGGLTEPARVTVNGAPAQVDSSNQFEGSVKVESGNNEIEVVATDGNGNEATQRYQLNVPAAATVTQQYDAIDNLTRKVEESNTTTYEWDAAARLAAINIGTSRSEFQYDGLNRRVRIVEKESGAVIGDKRFVWSGLTLSEERDSTGGVVKKRFSAQGTQVVGGPNGGIYFYARDHLGTIRQMTDTAGAVRADYSYDLFGSAAKVGGDLEADFGFTGHYYHQPSRQALTLYRAFDSRSGRWVSRDPLSERGGTNLYGYAKNNPANAVDPLGLTDILIAIAPRYFTPDQLADYNRRNPENQLTADDNAQDNRDNAADAKRLLAEYLAQNPPGKDDKVDVAEPDSKDKLLSDCKKYDAILVFAHGNETPGERYKIALGLDRVPVASLPKNVTAFGCNPSQGGRGGSEVMRDLLNTLGRELGK